MNIVITGGTGSIGQALCQEIVKRYSPNKIVIFSRDEFKQERMQHRYCFSNKDCKNLEFVIGDIRDYQSIYETLRENDIDILFHAAAMKHIEADELNPLESIKTNVLSKLSTISIIFAA